MQPTHKFKNEPTLRYLVFKQTTSAVHSGHWMLYMSFETLDDALEEISEMNLQLDSVMIMDAEVLDGGTLRDPNA